MGLEKFGKLMKTYIRNEGMGGIQWQVFSSLQREED